ncbi:hypothetical protein COLO4_05116 [Corchorus olitorius]|uniref:Uncharacterized protein n=1 Tax=Corchorus olitorius TaxID=93759 RepID=A0A1R3KRZ9_9ROSI|nr:hypothetical protein COLO4_05116 [Corchorus olitorius]
MAVEWLRLKAKSFATFHDHSLVAKNFCSESGNKNDSAIDDFSIQLAKTILNLLAD